MKSNWSSRISFIKKAWSVDSWWSPYRTTSAVWDLIEPRFKSFCRKMRIFGTSIYKRLTNVLNRLRIRLGFSWRSSKPSYKHSWLKMPSPQSSVDRPLSCAGCLCGASPISLTTPSTSLGPVSRRPLLSHHLRLFAFGSRMQTLCACEVYSSAMETRWARRGSPLGMSCKSA